ncbi:MAG: recombinase RecA [Acidobacteriota bacterium]
MATAATIRRQIESALADRIPAALTPQPRTVRPRWPTGVVAVDELLGGGLPVGAITEMAGPECSGRTSLALAFVAACTSAGRVCAWVDVSDSLSPEAAAAAGIRLDRLLWVRCGVIQQAAPAPRRAFHLPAQYFAPTAPIKGLHGGGCGGHPRTEVKGLAGAVGALLDPAAIAPRCAEPQRRGKPMREEMPRVAIPPAEAPRRRSQPRKPWPRMEQALRATDLLLQTGGFAVVVLDMASLAPEVALRVPLATWFRYRAAAERTQASVLLLTQAACAKSSAGLVLRMRQAAEMNEESTVFTGLSCRVEAIRERFQTIAKVVPLRKPPARESGADWQARSAWAGVR